MNDIFPTVKGKKRMLAEKTANPENKMTVSELCREFNISSSTYYKWNREEDFVGYVNFLIDKYTDCELANVWKALIEKAESGNTEAIKMYFEMKGKYKQQLNLSGKVVFVSGEDELLE